MGIRADRLDVAAHGDAAVRRADKGVAQPFGHGLHAPVLPQEAECRLPRAEIGDLKAVDLAQPLDLFPKPGHGAGIEDLQFKLAHRRQHRAGPQFHQDGQSRNFPQHDLGPLALEGQLILIALAFEVIGRQAHCSRTTP